MRCAVSERMEQGPGSGHDQWLASLSAAGVELVVVKDRTLTPARRLQSGDFSAVLLASGPATDSNGMEAGDDLRRHRAERELVRMARARRLPLVGIGRGAEFLGLYFGGRLRPHPGQQPGNQSLDLHRAPGQQPERETVHAAGGRLCDPEDFPAMLTPFAWDEHGNIAGFVHQNEPILGIHWQPAAPDDTAAQMILNALHGRRWPETSATCINLNVKAS